MANDLKDVLVRLENIEKALSGGGGTVARKSKVAELSADDIAAYHRVQNAFWDDGTCGINETSPCVFSCNKVSGKKVVPVIRICDRECICGPCNIWGSGILSGGGRFGGMGGG